MTVSRSLLAIVLSVSFFWGGALAQEFEPTDVFLIEGAPSLPGNLKRLVKKAGGKLLRTHREINVAIV